MSDREMAVLWRQTGRREYAVGLLLNYLPFIYGVAAGYLRDGDKAFAAVSEFAAAFHGMADRFDDSEQFGARLYREVVRHISGKEIDTPVIDDVRMEFLRGFRSGDESAVAILEKGRGGFAKPQRECMEFFLSKGEPFGTISERTGYLKRDIRSYIETALAELPLHVTNRETTPPDLGALHARFVHYVRDESADSASYEIELRSLWDRFLASALEGYAAIGGDHARELHALSVEISSGILPAGKRKAGRIVVAAVILVVAVSGFFIFRGGRQSELPKPSETLETSELPERNESIAESAAGTEPAAPDETAEAAEAAETAVPATVSPSARTGEDTGHDTDGVEGHGKAAVVRISEKAEGPTGFYVSVPAIGIGKYNEYLDKAIVKPADGWNGEVTLSFTVNRYGRPSRIKVVGFLSQEAHREAIRLISNGPEWMPSDEEVTIVLWME